MTIHELGFRLGPSSGPGLLLPTLPLVTSLLYLLRLGRARLWDFDEPRSRGRWSGAGIGSCRPWLWLPKAEEELRLFLLRNLAGVLTTGNKTPSHISSLGLSRCDIPQTPILWIVRGEQRRLAEMAGIAAEAWEVVPELSDYPEVVAVTPNVALTAHPAEASP